MNDHYGVSKLHWCRENIHRVKEAQSGNSLAWGPMASYLLFSLLREQPILVDPANAARTLHYNIDQLAWDADLAELFSLPLTHLPKVVASNYPYGHLDVDGLNIPLTVLNGDQSAALFANGWPDKNSLYINLGTGAFIQRMVEKPIMSAENLLSSIVWQSEDKVIYVLEGAVNGAGCAILNLAKMFNLPIPKLERESARWLLEEGEYPLFMNAESGLGSPY